jgi:pimeloyl-ACP methyl ester carboxylesterase
MSPESIASDFLSHLGGGEYDSAVSRMTSEMKAAIDSEQLAQIWDALPKQAGAFKGRGPSRTTSVGELTVVTVPLQFELATLDAVIAIDDVGLIAGFHLKPAQGEKAPPEPPGTGAQSGADNHFQEREVSIGGSDKGLPATLTLPKAASEGMVPAVVIVPGSGPINRDGAIGANTPYRDIAHALAKDGIASLRFDKRPLTWPEEFGDRDFTIREEIVADAVEAVRLLRTVSGIDARRIYVFGHSLGGLAAPLVAMEAREIAGLIFFAVPARSPLVLLRDQSVYLAELDGVIEDSERRALSELEAKIESMALSSAVVAGTSMLGAPLSYWRSIEKIDVSELLDTLALPALMLQGGRDYQVTSTDWAIWVERLGDNPCVSLQHYPALNHLGIAGVGKSVPAEYGEPGTVDVRMIHDVVAWIQSHAAAGCHDRDDLVRQGSLRPAL